MPIYLKISDGKGGIKIKGSVKKAAFLHWIELQSAQFGVGRGITTTGSHESARRLAAERPALTEIVVTKLADGSSTDLMRASLEGEGTPMTISFTQKTEDVERERLRVELQNTLISSYSLASGGDRPMESLTLNFTGIEFIQL